MATQQARLAALGVLVEAMGPGQRLIDVDQRLLVVGTVVLQGRQCQVAAIVAAIQLQRPLVVIKGRAAGVQILLQMLADEVELVDRVEIDGRLRRGGGIRQGFAHRQVFEIAQDRLALLIQQACLQTPLAGDGERLQPCLTRLQIQRLRKQHAPLVAYLEAGPAKRRHRIYPADEAVIATLQFDGGAGIGVLQSAKGVIGQEVLHEHLLFTGIQPGEVGLVVGIDPGHQLDVGAVVVGQVAIPGQTKIAVAPAPLLLARRHMVIRHVQQAPLLVMTVGTDEVVVGLVRHIGVGTGMLR